MKVGLIDVDGHNFPNLCLMKISAYHKAVGDSVDWWSGFEHYNRIYMRKVFTTEYTPDADIPVNAEEITMGGTGYGLDNKLPDEIEHQYPDYELYPTLTDGVAYGFLTRGCPRACPFCLVSEKEGRKSVKVADLDKFWRGQREIKLLDPNLIASKDHEALLIQLADSKAKVDFTQGLDARCITEDNAKLLEKIKTKMVHFAFDDIKQEQAVIRGLKIYAKHSSVGERNRRVYILTNFNTTHDEDMYRIRTVQALGYWPYVMVYNKPTAPKITRQLQRWSNNGFIYWSNRDFSQYDVRIG